MSLEISAITDLAIMMTVAAVIALIFYRLKQPIVVGYLIAGIIVNHFRMKQNYEILHRNQQHHKRN